LIRNKKTKQLFSLRKLPSNCKVRGHYVCMELPVILVNRVEEKKRIIGKTMEG
jgi:hypothetical protein